MSKVPASKGLEGKELEDAHASAMTQATKNLEEVYAGKVTKGRATKAGAAKAGPAIATLTFIHGFS
mgnify:CR=1 FL=1